MQQFDVSRRLTRRHFLLMAPLLSACLAATPTPQPPQASTATPSPTKRPTQTQTPTQAPSPKPKTPKTLVALVFGQSNAGSWGESKRTAGPNVQVFYKGKYSRAADPLLNTDGDRGSVWTRLGDKLIAAKLYDKVIFVPFSRGGTEIVRWGPKGDLNGLLMDTIRDAQKNKLVFTHLLWHHGEADNRLKTSAEIYKKEFLGMVKLIRDAGVNAPLFVATATLCSEFEINPALRKAQTDVISPKQNILAGPDTDTLSRDLRHDWCHFNDKGLEQHADLWLAILKQHAQTATP